MDELLDFDSAMENAESWLNQADDALERMLLIDSGPSGPQYEINPDAEDARRALREAVQAVRESRQFLASSVKSAHDEYNRMEAEYDRS